MKLTTEWLKDHISTNKTEAQIVEKLNNTGIEVESVESVKNDLSDFLDKLYYCLENWGMSQEIIKNAYIQFHKKHTWVIRASQYENQFKTLISREE